MPLPAGGRAPLPGLPWVASESRAEQRALNNQPTNQPCVPLFPLGCACPPPAGVRRYWYILNGQGRSQEVKGPGVVGEQPELAPGESFSYQSGEDSVGLAAGWLVGSQPAFVATECAGIMLSITAAPNPPSCRLPASLRFPLPPPAACPLPTPKGSMEGHFEMYAKDADSGQWRKSFLVKIGQFALRAD